MPTESRNPTVWILTQLEELQKRNLEFRETELIWKMQIWRWVYNQRPKEVSEVRSALRDLAEGRKEYPRGLAPINPDPGATAAELLAAHADALID